MAELVTAIGERDLAALEALLADHVVFHSPVATYAERADVVHLLATIGSILDALTAVREVAGERERVTVITARCGEAELDGILDERLAGDGRIEEVTLLLRPLGAVRPTVRRMGEALAASPLPSGRPPG